ncbi:ras GTPase-activating protein-binding 1, partial [Sigmodon hispidus]
MLKPSPLDIGLEFVKQYYCLLIMAPDILHRFYGKNSSYVHGGLDSNGTSADAVYGQEEIHKKLMSQNYTNCHIKIIQVDAQATLNGGIVVQVMGTLSKNNQAERRFMQTFVLAPQGSVGNKFYVYNDIFRYHDEVCCLVTEPQEESEKKIEKPDEKHQTPELEPDDSTNLNDQNVSKDLQENLEKPDMKLEPKPEPLPDIKEDKPEPAPEKGASEDVQKSTSSAPGDVAPAQKDLKAVTWAEVVSKNLPPKGTVPVKQILPHLVKVKPAQPHPELKTKTQVPGQRPQKEQRFREQRTSIPAQNRPRP